ncbi:MFS transporter [Glutamicibacter sp.]|uniref:MFS transporter n=1 Tax=Glutamicibacter sp. TaxID=1931995 RepID=UPI002B4A42E8|nr:MFS transporter [Glutamicibacter sp.]HJX78609.1 MFS transporter [Glutamicibacter sp.]
MPIRSVPSWATTTVLALCGMVVALQQTLVVPLLPDFPVILGVSAEDSSWLVTATLLSAAIFTPVISRMADMYGKRKMLILALAVMTAGSLVAAIGGSFGALIAGRAMQGFASSLIPVGISVLRDELPKEKVASAVALMSATLGIGSALGMPMSGLLYNAYGWESLFWVSAALGLVFLVGVLLLVKESKITTPGRFDIAGALVLSVLLTAALLAISKGASWGWANPLTLGLFALSLALLAGWIPLQLRVNQPMIDLRTAVKRPVLLTNVSSFFLCVAMFVNMLITTQQLQIPEQTGYGFGLSVLVAGLAMVPSGLAMVALSGAAGAMLNRWGGKPTIIFGGAIMALTYIARVFLDDAVWQIIVGATLVNVGVAFSYAAMPTLIMSAVPITETASANGVNALIRSLGTTVASALTGLILATMVVEYNGVPLPSLNAMHLSFWLAALAAIIGIGIALFIPSSSPAPKTKINVEETMVHGRVIMTTRPGSQQPAIVTFVREDGVPGDWARTDHEGQFSAVLPGPGRYVVVANAAGWVPSSHLVTFSEGITEHDIELHHMLSLSGVVASGETAVAGALVSLSAGAGDFIAATHTDDLGGYTLDLPPVGTYVLTAASPQTETAASVKVILRARTERVDIELPA